MDFLTATIYGIIQGVTEFAPVSSSGHLALLPYFMEIKDPGVVFDLVMHLGTAIAVIAYFYKDILKLIAEYWDLIKTRDIKKNAYALNFTVATFSSVLLILLIKDLAFEYGRSKNWIGGNLIVFGLLMYLADLKESRGVDLVGKSNIKCSVWIGLSQSVAVFPGVSRSGITMTMARVLGLSRQEAGRFSFLLSLPIILASIGYKTPAILKGEAIDVSLPIIFIGVLVSSVFGFLTIHFFLKAINRLGLGVFFIYRLILGGAILLL